MLVFLNGKFVAEEKAVVSVFDRSFLYGDGLFEGVRIANGKPFRWSLHMKRFLHGVSHLKIRLPFSPDEIEKFAAQLIRKNTMREGLLRLTLSRGVGVRGYSPRGANSPIFVMTLHDVPKIDLNRPPLWKLVTSSSRLPAKEPLARFKKIGRAHV